MPVIIKARLKVPYQLFLLLTSLLIFSPIVQAEIPHAKVLLIRHESNISDISGLVGKISAGLAEFCTTPGSCDLVVTPEYSFTPRVNRVNYSVDVDCSNLPCSISANGGNSAQVVQAVGQIQSLAAQYQVKILLATVFEHQNVDAVAYPNIPGGNAYFTSILHLNRNGQITYTRRKLYDYWQEGASESCVGLYFGTPEYDACQEDLAALAEETIRTETIHLPGPFELKYFPIICAERTSLRVVTNALNIGARNLDALIGPENEGDTDYEGIEQAVQQGYWTPDIFSWDWGIRDTFIQNYVNTGVVKPGAYLLAVDGAFGNAGAFRLMEPPAPLEITHGPYGCTAYLGDCDYKLIHIPGRRVGGGGKGKYPAIKDPQL